MRVVKRVQRIRVSPSVWPLFFPSFCPSVHPFRQFSWNWLITFFLKLCIVLEAHMEINMAEPVLLKKFPFSKSNQKWPKFELLGHFRKLYSLVLSGNGVEWKYLWPFNLLQKSHLWEKSGSQVKRKMLLANQIAVFFNCQYIINGLNLTLFVACR